MAWILRNMAKFIYIRYNSIKERNFMIRVLEELFDIFILRINETYGYGMGVMELTIKLDYIKITYLHPGRELSEQKFGKECLIEIKELIKSL